MSATAGTFHDARTPQYNVYEYHRFHGAEKHGCQMVLLLTRCSYFALLQVYVEATLYSTGTAVCSACMLETYLARLGW